MIKSTRGAKIMDLALKIVFLVGGSTITVLAITAMVIATVGLYKMVKEG